MKVTLTLERMEEIALCIVHNNLNENEACEYAKACALECNLDDCDIEDVNTSKP